MTEMVQPSEVLFWKGDETAPNFGDYITEMLLHRALLGPRIRASRYRLIGSIIDDENVARDLADVTDGGPIAYWGCGARDERPLRADLRRRCRFQSVRGPLTRDLLDLPTDTVLGDTGLLLPLVHPPVAPDRRHGQTVCIPHFYEPASDTELLALTGVDRIVRPGIAPSLAGLEAIIDQITGADFVLAGAMHAAVVAHAYDIPFAFFDCGHLDIPFKWRDFSASIGIPTLLVNSLADGRSSYEIVRRRVKRAPLLPILEAAPFYVRPSVVLKAIAIDGMSGDPAALMAASGIEAPARADEAAASEQARDQRIATAFDQQSAQLEALDRALAEAQARTVADQQALETLSRAQADLERGRADDKAILALKQEEIVELRRAAAKHEAEVASIQLDLDDALGEIRVIENELAHVSRVRDRLAEEAAWTGKRLRKLAADAERRTQDLEMAFNQAHRLADELREAQTRIIRLESELARSEDRRHQLNATIEGIEQTRHRLDAEATQSREALAAERDQDRVRFEEELAQLRGSLAAGETARELLLSDAAAAAESAAAELSKRQSALSSAEAREAALTAALMGARRQEREARYKVRLLAGGRSAGADWAPPFVMRTVRLRQARAAAQRGDWGQSERAYAAILLAAPDNGRALVQ